MKRAGRRTVNRSHRTLATIRSTGLSSRRETGIPSSQVLYAQHADTLSQNSRPQDPGRRAAIRAKAVAYLEHAAARGSADAYLMLASSYERGGLTQKNPALAYSYLSALAKVTGDPGVANKAISLRSFGLRCGCSRGHGGKTRCELLPVCYASPRQGRGKLRRRCAAATLFLLAEMDAVGACLA